MKPGPLLPWCWRPKGRQRKLPAGARALCKRCHQVPIKRGKGRRFCGGCSKNIHTRRRWKKAGERESY